MFKFPFVNKLGLVNKTTGTAFLKLYPDAAVAYSLQQLSQEPTNVVRVRRSYDNTEEDFSANDVKNGNLRNWSLGETINAGVYFEGTNTYISYDFGVDSNSYFGACTITAKIYVSDASVSQSYFSYGQAAYRLYSNSSGTWGVNTTILTGKTVTVGYHEVELVFNASGACTSFLDNGVEQLSGTVSNGTTVTFTQLNIMARAGSLYGKGTLWDFAITGSSVQNLSWSGNTNTSVGWYDATENIQGTINGTAAAWTGQVLNAQVPIWYDQRVPTSKQVMFFNSVDTKVTTNSAVIPSAGTDFEFKFKFVVPNGYTSPTTNTSIIDQIETVTSGRVFLISISSVGRLNIFLGNTLEDYSLVGYNDGNVHEVRVIRVGSVFTTYIDNQLVGTIDRVLGDINVPMDIGWSSTLSGGRFLHGSVFDIELVGVGKWGGNGSTASAWKDQVGSNDGTIEGTAVRCSQSLVLANDAVQATALNQPFIVVNGDITKTELGNACIRKGPLNTCMMMVPSSQLVNSSTGAWSVFGTSRYVGDLSGVAHYIFGHDSTTNRVAQMMKVEQSTLRSIAFSDTVTTANASAGAATPGTSYIQSGVFTGTVMNVYKNGVAGSPVTLVGTAIKLPSTSNVFSRGSDGSSVTNEHETSEIIVFPNDKSTDRVKIEKSINSRWKVY